MYLPEIKITGPGIAQGVCALDDLVKAPECVLYDEAAARWRRRR
jgi:hypothetical protein